MSDTTESTSRLVLQGDPSGLVSSMQRAEAQVKMFEGSMANVTGTIGKFTGVVGVIGAVLAGGAMFKDAVNETNKWTGEAVKLSKILGITTEEASALNLALGDVYLTMEDMTAGAAALNKNTLKNVEAFSHYGIALKDYNGHQRSTLEVMNDVNAKLLTIKEGRDRELAGLQLYGKGWNEARGLLKLTAEAMDDARRKAEELHLIVGPEAVARTKAYKAAMNDVEDIFMAMKIQIGNQLLPILSNLGIWFNDIGPTALFIFTGALKGIMTFVQSVTLGVNILWEVWKAFWAQFSATSQTLVGVVANVVSGNFKQAADWAKWGWTEIGKAGEEGFDNIVKKAAATNEQLQLLWGLKQPAARSAAPKADAAVDLFDNEKTAGLMGAEDARLKAILASLKAREQAEKESATTTSLEWEYFYRTGTLMEFDYQQQKFEIDKKALQNTVGLIDDEIAAIKSSLVTKLDLAKSDGEKEKLREDAKKETTEKIAEKNKLNQELYRLDVKYQTDSQILKQQMQFDDAAMLSDWASRRVEADKSDLDKTREFLAMLAEARGQATDMELLRIDREQLAWEQHWAMAVDTESQYEARRLQLKTFYDKERTKVNKNELQGQLGTVASTFNQMAGLANSFHQLTGKKNKEAFIAYQVLKSAETVVTTGTAAMTAFDNGMKAGGPYGGWALALAWSGMTIAMGAAQIASIWSASADGGGSLGAGSGGGGSGGSPSSGMVTQQISTPAQSAPQYTIVVNGAIGERKWFEDNLPGILRDMASRNVNIGVQYS